MKTWYQHVIADWMDGTASLDDGPYRVYHVIIQKIYENEGPISLNEASLAGLCNQHILTFRKNLKTLVDLGKVKSIAGKLSNDRVRTELKRIASKRKVKQAAGKASGEVRRGFGTKTLENKESTRAHVQEETNYLKREEENRKEKDSGAKAPAAIAADPRTRLFNEGLETLMKLTGKGPDSARNFLGKCLKASNDDAIVVLGLIEDAERNRAADPGSYISARLKPMVTNGKTPGLGSAADRALEKTRADLEASQNTLQLIPPRPVRG
jgi:uncharacterized protein YdaU (DUF1376 family)